MWLDLPLTGIEGDGSLTGGSEGGRRGEGNATSGKAKSKRAQGPLPVDKIAEFLKKYPTAKIVIVVDTHCLEESGAFIWKGTTPDSYRACSLKEVSSTPIIDKRATPNADILTIDHHRLPPT